MALAGPPPVDAMIAVHGDRARSTGIVLAHQLRRAGFRIEIDHRAVGMKAQFKRADKLGAARVIAIGESELADGTVTLREMAARTERKLPLADVIEALRRGA